MMFALCPACSGRSVTIPGIVGHDRGIPDIYPQRASVTITGMTGHDPPEYPEVSREYAGIQTYLWHKADSASLAQPGEVKAF